MLNEGQRNRILEAGKNPDYQHYMQVTFPNWMACLPGGKMFDRSVSIVLQWNDWHNACEELLTGAEELGIFLDGWPARRNVYPEQWFFAQKYSRGAEVYKLRRKWKQRMAVLGWDCGPELWEGQAATEKELTKFHAHVDELHEYYLKEKEKNNV